MADPTVTHIDPLGSASATGNDYEGTTFTDGVSSASGTVVTKVGAFAGTRVNDKIFLTDNGSGDVVPLLYKVTARTNDTITVADIRSGGGEATDVKCTLADGSVNLPFATPQFTLDKITQDGSNGDRLVIKKGVDDVVLDSALSVTTYGTPTAALPLIFQGYTSVAGDGGEGGIDANGGNAIWSSTTIDGIFFIDMHLHGSTAAIMLQFDDIFNLIRCRVDDCTGKAVNGDAAFRIINCAFSNCSGSPVLEIGGRGLMTGCFFEDTGVNAFGAIVVQWLNSLPNSVMRNNIVKLRSASSSLCYSVRDAMIVNNTAYCVGGNGTGKGFVVTSTNADWDYFAGNYAEGFGGAGGVGYQLSADDTVIYEGENFAFNNTTNFDLSAATIIVAGTQTVMGSSGLVDPDNNDFTPKGDLLEAGDPKVIGVATGVALTTFLDAGAVQKEEPAGGGGGGLLMPNKRGNKQ